MDSPGTLEVANSSVEASTQRLEDLSLCDNPQGVEDDKRATDGLSQLGSTEPDSSPPHPNDPSRPVTLTPEEGYTRTVKLDRCVSCGEIVYCVSISPSGNLFAAGCESFTYVYTIETGHLLCTVDHGAAMYVKSVCFGPDESLIAAGDSNGTIRIGNMKDGSQHDWVHDPFATFASHPLKYVSVHFSPGGDRLVSGGIDEKVRIWDVADRTEVGCLNAENVVDAVAVSDKYIAAGLAGQGGVRVWNLESGDKVADLAGADGHTRCVFSVAWDRDRVFSASLDGTLKEWQLNIAGGRYAAFEGAQCVRTYMGHGFGLSVGLMSDWILSCSGWEVLLRQRGSGSVESRLHGHEGRVMSVDGNSEHGIIVSGSKDGTACVWRLGKRPVDKTA
ncbi:hypothetical protein Purlil1_14104 [Purpureocillium lilacinum]|uniref:Uncharacterized protein n=1 Tax=Purpureocillium lilacinum TaxID=33203 RepID=A0ABR0BC73_PURLI|nr:hypothetical protein Purlil1_14104 [Purpureocillium lilacinum]